MDMSKMMRNKSGDPFYDIPASQTFKLGLKRDFTRFVQAGADISYIKGRRIYPLYKEDVGPGLENEKGIKGVSGTVWMSLRW